MSKFDVGYAEGFVAGQADMEKHYDTAVQSLRDTLTRLKESNEVICQLAMQCLDENTVTQIRARVERLR